MIVITKKEAAEWSKIDFEDPILDELIRTACDIAEGSIDNFTDKLKSAKFRRKLKLFILNIIVDMYDNRGITTDEDNKLQYVNQTMLFQLKYGTYSEEDV